VRVLVVVGGGGRLEPSNHAGIVSGWVREMCAGVHNLFNEIPKYNIAI